MGIVRGTRLEKLNNASNLEEFNSHKPQKENCVVVQFFTSNAWQKIHH